MSCKINLLRRFCISMKSLFVTEIYCNQLIMFFEVWIIKKAIISIVNSLIRHNFLDISICSYVIFFSLIKKVLTINCNIGIFCFCICKKVSCVPCSDRFIFGHKNLEQSGNINIAFVSPLILLDDICSS